MWIELLPACWKCCFDCNCTSAQFFPYFEISTTSCKAVRPVTVNHVLGTLRCQGSLQARIWGRLQRFRERPCLECRAKIIHSDNPGSIHQQHQELIRYLLRHAKDVPGIYSNSLTGIQRSKASRRGWAAGNNPAHRKSDHTKNRLAISWIDE